MPLRRMTAALALLLVALPRLAAQQPGDEFFERKVRPVLVEQCYNCHSVNAKKLKGGLFLDSRAGMLRGGDNGPTIVPGNPDKSKLIEAVRYGNVDLQMPPRGKLSDSVIADLVAWVKSGAPWPDEKKVVVGGKGEFDLAKRKADHWAWQPIKPVAPPKVKDERWPVDPVDRFLLARLETAGLKPAAAADRRTLIRRLSFDLTGLPPAPADVEKFVASAQPQAAYEELVDRLLASPHFGERWGRHWLDLVRYAETRGHEFDYTLPNAWQYRDYVIRALNADVPYDQFVREHLAGDLLTEPRLHPKDGTNESILGTGFWFLGEQIHSPVDVCQDRADRVDNMIDVMTKTFLGMTVACARCHDHKFDAISTKDYYALCGFVASSNYRLVPFDTLEANRKAADTLRQQRAKDRPVVQKAIADALRPEVAQMAKYLHATSEVLIQAKKVEEVARGRDLDPARLARWVRRVQAAAKDEGHPLHVWACAAKVPGALPPPVPMRAPRDASDAVTVVVDYARLAPGSWLADGFAFGTGPVRPGELRVGKTVRFQDTAAADRDPAWDRPALAPGTENEPGALGGIPRSGMTLCSPSFEVGPGKVYALVRGSGHLYAAVEGHVMIAGPLHGQLVRSFKTGPRFEWVEQDLTAYKGRRAHLEMTAAAGADLTIAKVVQAAAKPVTPPDRREYAFQLTYTPSAPLAEVARLYATNASAAIDRLAADRTVGSSMAGANARLCNSLLDELDLSATLAPLLAEQARLAAHIPRTSRLAPAMLDGSGVDENVFIRGNYKTPGPQAPRRFLSALVRDEPLAVKQGSGRLELASQITDPAVNPLLPRVMVNRVWHHLFGRGIVPSVDNFGVLGEPPSHAELLDHLADRFVKEGWSVRKLIRALLLTRAYQMASEPSAEASKLDPQNRLLHRMNIRRLEGEAIRDAMLAVSGRLDRKTFGPPVPTYLTEFQDGRGRPGSGPLDGDGRRSLYISVRRNFLPSLLLAFDTPVPFSTVGKRTVSNVPAQALILLNDPFVHLQAGVWAKRVMVQSNKPEERAQGMYLAAFSRPATDTELRACLAYIDEQTRLTNEPAAWAGLAHVLFNTKEFIFLQ